MTTEGFHQGYADALLMARLPARPHARDYAQAQRAMGNYKVAHSFVLLAPRWVIDWRAGYDRALAVLLVHSIRVAAEPAQLPTIAISLEWSEHDI